MSLNIWAPIKFFNLILCTSSPFFIYLTFISRLSSSGSLFFFYEVFPYPVEVEPVVVLCAPRMFFLFKFIPFLLVIALLISFA